MSGDFPFLTVLILLPAGGALAMALCGLDKRFSKEFCDIIGIGTALATLAFAIGAVVDMKVGVGGFQFVSNHVYSGSTLGVRWYLGLDGISVFLVLLAALLFPLVLVIGRHRPNSRNYFAWMLLLEAAVMGSFVSLDLLVFFFFVELTLVPTHFVIVG